jgi:hypothetical protein
MLSRPTEPSKRTELDLDAFLSANCSAGQRSFVVLIYRREVWGSGGRGVQRWAASRRPALVSSESFARHSEYRDSTMSALSFVKRSVDAFLLHLMHWQVLTRRIG